MGARFTFHVSRITIEHRLGMGWLADLILLIHFLFVLFVTGGLALIWIGAWRRWGWVRGFRFRLAHLAAFLFVAGEAVVGATCPLTLWEDALRGVSPERGFIARWVQALLYYDAPPWVFTVIYLAFAALAAFTFWRIPPRRRLRRYPPVP